MSTNNDAVVLVTAGYDRTIRFWQANTGVTYRTILHEDSVREAHDGRQCREDGLFCSFSLADELSSDTSAEDSPRGR